MSTFVAVPALLNTRKFGGYAGTRVGEAQIPGPATHERDWTVTEQPDATHRRNNEARDSVPRSQDAVTRAVQKLRITDSPAASVALPALTANNGEFQETAAAETTAQGAQENTSAVRSAALLPTSIGRLLMEVSCSIWCRSTEVRCCLKTVCDNCVGSTARPVCTVAQSDRSGVAGATPAGSILLSTNFALGTGQTTARASGRSGQWSGNRAATSSELEASASRRTFGRQPLPNCPIWDVVLTDRDKPLLTKLRRASAMAFPRCVVSRYATAWAESLEGAMSSHQSWALLCHCRCRLLLAEIPQGVDRNSEPKQWLQFVRKVSVLIGKVLGHQNSGPLRRTAGKTQPQTDEQRGKRACALTARGSVSKAMKGLVGGAAQVRRTAAGAGLQPSSRGARVLELIPAAWATAPQCPAFLLKRTA